MSIKQLHIGEDFNLPLDFITQTQAILAKRRVGKTYTGQVQAEEFLRLDQQIIAIDPTGAWWGLKSSADGKAKGYPVVIFGGEHADVPLEPNAGEIIAQAIVENGFSAIIDLSLFRKSQIPVFMGPFLETLYRLNREAMHIFIDEADTFAPQKPFGEEARMLGAMEDLVKKGGIRGLGATLITQRPAVLNKNVLTQCEVLCVLRIVHHMDIKAIKLWIDVHGDPEKSKQMIADLPSLPIGEAWFWSPGFGDIFRRVKIRQKQTFDSGRTPKPGEKRVTPKVVAEIDLHALGIQIQQTIEQKKANDPKELKARIAQLEKQLSAKQVAGKTIEVPVEVVKEVVKQVEVPVVLKANIIDLEQLTEQLVTAVGNMGEILASAHRLRVEALTAASASAPTSAPASKPKPNGAINPAHSTFIKATPATIESTLTPPPQMSKAERSILTILQVHGPSSIRNVALLAGYSMDGGAFRGAMSDLKKAGLLKSENGILETRTHLDDVEDLPTGAELVSFWLGKLSQAEATIIRVLREYGHDGELTTEQIAEHAQYAVNGGGFRGAMGALKTIGLISGSGTIRLAEELRA